MNVLGSMGLFIVGIIFNVFILWLWWRAKKKNGKELAWYWGWILPTDIFALAVLSLVGIGATISFAIYTFPLRVRKTEKQLVLIEKAAYRYYQDTGEFPDGMDELIRNSPVKKDWALDAWGTEVRLIDTDTEFQIVSAASDKAFETSDDLFRKIRK